MLDASDEDEALPETLAAPTTSSLPAKAKKLRKSKVGRDCWTWAIYHMTKGETCQFLSKRTRIGYKSYFILKNSEYTLNIPEDSGFYLVRVFFWSLGFTEDLGIPETLIVLPLPLLGMLLPVSKAMTD